MRRKGEVNKLAQDFKCSREFASMALNDKADTPRARMIRAAALERGGKKYTMVESPK